MAGSARRSPGDRREQIVAAAAALFADRGFGATSMADIVAASGVATGTVYRYFGGKEDVVDAVCAAAVGIGPGTSGPDVTATEAVSRMLAAATDPEHARLTSKVWAHAPASSALQVQIAERHERVRRWLACTIARPAEPGPSHLIRADLVICALGGIQERVAAGVPLDVAGLRRELLALVT